MTARAARIRTESMAVRLSKQPISEGYALWDKGFTLGAMRLFIFKAESVPPFQLAGCLDAIAHLMVEVGENEDAVDNFTSAAEKYEMIQNPVLGKLMRAKIFEAKGSAADAHTAAEAIISEYDADGTAASKDAKTKTALARVYCYLAELDATTKVDQAKTSLNKALELGWDRVHVGHLLKATLCVGSEDLDGALEAFNAAGAANANCLAAFEGAAEVLKMQSKFDEAVANLEKAIALHPRTTLVNEKAIVLSMGGKDAAALEFLDKYIADPPQEELDPNAAPTRRSTLYKAKAAILADVEKFDEALEVLAKANEADAGDAEVASMIEGINAAKAE
eukprot:PhM_4_TR11572/c0_g1_i2/m.81396